MDNDRFQEKADSTLRYPFRDQPIDCPAQVDRICTVRPESHLTTARERDSNIGPSLTAERPLSHTWSHFFIGSETLGRYPGKPGMHVIDLLLKIESKRIYPTIQTRVTRMGIAAVMQIPKLRAASLIQIRGKTP
jgi:hypothetical protein